MTLTLITINLNNLTGLQNTLESVLFQTTTNYEDLGLYPSIYERQDAGLSEGHLQMYRKYYSALQSPVVSSSWGKRIHALAGL